MAPPNHFSSLSSFNSPRGPMWSYHELTANRLFWIKTIGCLLEQTFNTLMPQEPPSTPSDAIENGGMVETQVL